MNSEELRVAITRANVSLRELADKLGVSEQAFYNKLNGRTEFKNSEILKLAKILGLSMKSVNLIFFGNGVN